jgi:polysaccharide deacetylase family protein (PEP-CTERM system associated)
MLPLSLDWEDWFQLCCPPYDAPGALEAFEDRLPRATDLALGLCEDLGVRGTWFCLVDQARRHPELLRRIVAGGHRIGLHGLTHVRAFTLDEATFDAQLREGRAALEDLSGTAVTGYRAPEWSLRGAAEERWRRLPDLGFTFDSSRVPMAVLGDQAWPRRAHRLPNGLWELPPPVLGWGPCTMPAWGWGQRLLPARWLRIRFEHLAESQAGTPLVLHPWELDEAQPRLPVATRGHRFAHSAGLRGLAARLRGLWSGLPLVPLEDWIAAAEAREVA